MADGRSRKLPCRIRHHNKLRQQLRTEQHTDHIPQPNTHKPKPRHNLQLPRHQHGHRRKYRTFGKFQLYNKLGTRYRPPGHFKRLGKQYRPFGNPYHMANGRSRKLPCRIRHRLKLRQLLTVKQHTGHRASDHPLQSRTRHALSLPRHQ